MASGVREWRRGYRGQRVRRRRGERRRGTTQHWVWIKEHVAVAPANAGQQDFGHAGPAKSLDNKANASEQGSAEC
eukprot:11158437-Lingulodinium_polyedra.AAC.1